MATYAIGDVQGCFDELQALLSSIAFDPTRDRLWLTGDLVNRGPCSLETLRFVRALGDCAVTVLGNHDLHLLALAEQNQDTHRGSLRAVLDAPDRAELLGWLRAQPLLHHDAALGFTLVHAGLPPQWDLAQAQRCAVEVETVLRGDDYRVFFRAMYGDYPDRWSGDLAGWDRLRFIVNCLTRLRFCDADGRLAFDPKGPPGSQPPGLMPWFAVPGRASVGMRIVCGHWSALGFYREKGIYALDTGCIWGGALTALRLEDLAVFSEPCGAACNPGGPCEPAV